MNDTVPPSTLRQLRAHLARPQTLAVLVGVAVVLSVAGAFGSDSYLRLVPRVIYWTVLAVLTYAAGFVVTDTLSPRLGDWPRWAALATVGAAVGAVASGVVVTVNLVVFGIFPEPEDLPEFLATIFAVSYAVTLVADILGRPSAPAGAARAPVAGAAPDPPPILDRLPLDKRAPLVALSVEDHYVRVLTTRGEELVLMRLSDAIREVGATPGAQVHRSHWAAFGQVTAARREGDRAVLTMATGAEIPVSRANLPKVREAGLLPR